VRCGLYTAVGYQNRLSFLLSMVFGEHSHDAWNDIGSSLVSSAELV
jgi:hypothetical protein